MLKIFENVELLDTDVTLLTVVEDGESKSLLEETVSVVELNPSVVVWASGDVGVELDVTSEPVVVDWVEEVEDAPDNWFSSIAKQTLNEKDKVNNSVHKIIFLKTDIFYILSF